MLDYNPQNVVVKDICDELISSVSECAKSKNISITFFESDYSTIKADQNMLKTILRNLLSNAIKFTHNNGQILIYTESSNDNFIFTVSDNGVGISKEDQLKLWDFTNYFSTPGTNNEQGTGLGLLICKRFVEAHGGEIWVESDPSSKTNGKGSDFKFSIPISS
jgi:signal transduction histidine kinase